MDGSKQPQQPMLVGGAKDAVTYCPQRESEEGDKQRRPVPAGDAVNQQTAVI